MSVKLCFLTGDFPDSFYEMAVATREIQELAGDARDFDKVKWIKRNCKYPADPPAELRAYQDALYEIPQEYQHQLMPEPTFRVNVIQFTELQLPGTTSTLIEYAAKNCFSEHECEDNSARRRFFSGCWTLLTILEWNTKVRLPGGAGHVSNFARRQKAIDEDEAEADDD